MNNLFKWELFFGGGVTLAFILSTGDIMLDQNRVYGYPIPTAGDIVIDDTDASDDTTSIIYHSDLVEPEYSVIGGGYTFNIEGTYVPNVSNIICMTKSGTVINISIAASI